jgi:2-iminobutanoate/2-iminopropanoate deaminase
MELSKVHTTDAPAAIGPYSQAIIAGNLVFCSGQTGFDPKTMQFAADDVQGQTQQVIHNLRAVLRAAGSDLQYVVKTTVFLSDMENFQEMNEVYARIFEEFTQTPPARTTIAAKDLPRGALVEIDAIAVRP